MTPRNDILFSFIVMIASALLFSLMGLLVGLAHGIDPWKMSLFRFVVGLALVGMLALVGKIKINFVNHRMLLTRGIVGGISVYLYYFSLARIGVAQGTIINNTYPLFAVALGTFFLKDRAPVLAWIFLVTGMAGVFLMASHQFDPAHPFQGFDLDIYFFLALFGAFLAGAAVVSIKTLVKTDSPYGIYLAQCLLGFWLVVVPANLEPSRAGWSAAFLLLGIGLSAALAQLLMTWSFKKLSVASGTMVSFLTTLLNILIGVVIFHEPFSVSQKIGAALVVAACLGVIFVEMRGKRPA